MDTGSGKTQMYASTLHDPCFHCLVTLAEPSDYQCHYANSRGAGALFSKQGKPSRSGLYCVWKCLFMPTALFYSLYGLLLPQWLLPNSNIRSFLSSYRLFKREFCRAMTMSTIGARKVFGMRFSSIYELSSLLLRCSWTRCGEVLSNWTG